jgi:hypothetical protein
MAVQTGAGTRISIGPTTAATTPTAYAALTPWTEIGEVEDLGEFGDNVGLANFTALNNRRVRKFKTSFDAGDLQLTLGRDPADAGQVALAAAVAADADYAIRIELDDKPTPTGKNTVFYFHAAVTKLTTQVGNADAIVKGSVNMAINTTVLIVPAAA